MPEARAAAASHCLVLTMKAHSTKPSSFAGGGPGVKSVLRAVSRSFITSAFSSCFGHAGLSVVSKLPEFSGENALKLSLVSTPVIPALGSKGEQGLVQML